MAGTWGIIKNLWDTFDNNPDNQRTVDSMKGMLGLLPAGAGDVASGLLAADDVRRGDYTSAALNGVGVLPFIPSMAGMVKGKGDDIAKAISNVDDYGGLHRPPMKDNGGAPLFDLTGGGEVYPDDIYSPQAVQYYGTGERAMDAKTMRIINSYRNEPDAPVTMYRAVPLDVPADAKINHGDWVTVNPDYAKMHGEGPLNGEYRIIQQQVPARKLFTNGDSIHEYGYDETGKINPALLPWLTGAGLLGAGGMYYSGE